MYIMWSVTNAHQDITLYILDVKGLMQYIVPHKPACQISLVNGTHLFAHRFEILHRAQHYNCRAMCKILERFVLLRNKLWINEIQVYNEFRGIYILTAFPFDRFILIKHGWHCIYCRSRNFIQTFFSYLSIFLSYNVYIQTIAHTENIWLLFLLFRITLIRPNVNLIYASKHLW